MLLRKNMNFGSVISNKGRTSLVASRRSRRRRVRTAGLAAFSLGLVTAVTGGCPGKSSAKGDCQPTDLDFERLVPLARAALELTDCNLGIIDEDFLLKRQPGAAQRVQVGDVFYMFRTSDEPPTQLVALSGTTGPLNNRFNLQAELVMDEIAGGRVHAGYRDLALAIRDDLLPRLRRDQPVTLVGFSQGGAVAALLPLWLQADGITVELVITLGQPKVTDGGLAGRLALLPLLRFVAADDVIPAYPRQPDYSHFGRAITLLDGPFVTVLSPGDPGYVDPRELPDELPDFLLLDHGTYDARLESKLGATVCKLPAN